MEKHVLEFRAMDDDAWYSVQVAVEGEVLTIQFQFPETVKFVASEFQSEEEIVDVVKRFREISPQLQDNECGKVKEGSVVCACSGGDSDVRYYDAFVEAVHRKEHSFVNGEEECLCTFVLSWLHGPNKGLLTDGGIECVCTVNECYLVDQKIGSFFKMAKDKFRMCSQKSTAISKRKVSTLAEGGSHLSLNQKGSQTSLTLTNGKDAGTMSDNDPYHDQDTDLGGEPSTNHFILIGNLERNLSPSSIRGFIHRHTSISPKVFVLPCPSSTPFARAVIVLDCEKESDKVYKFVDNPNHIIVSMRGRPWVAIERAKRHGISRSPLGAIIRRFQDIFKDDCFDKELFLVPSGTEVYKCAEQLRDLFVDFCNHEKLLHRRFVEEEIRILQPFSSAKDST